MKTLKCTNCGANLDAEDNQVNVKCKYCNVITRFESLQEIEKRKAVFHSKYERAKMLIAKDSFIEANKILNSIVDEDVTQSRAWFLKSQLPILEQDSIVFEKCYVNANTFARLKKREDMSVYLGKCGLPLKYHRKFIDFFNKKDFLFEQQLTFINKAIDNALADKIQTYKDEKEIIIKNSKKFKGHQRFISAGIHI